MRTLPLDTPITDLYVEYTYTLVRLKAHALTAGLVGEFVLLEDKLRGVLLQEISLIQAEAQGEALIDVADDDLDMLHFLITATVVMLSGNDRTHPLYVRFFGSERPSDMRRPILGEQLATMRTWIATLDAAPQPALAAHAKPLSEIVGRADNAVTAAAAATRALTDFNTLGERKACVDEFNALRSRLSGQLGELRHRQPEANLPADFAEQFFRRDRRSSRIPTISGQERVIARLEQQLGRQREILAALQAERSDSERMRVEAEEAMLRQELEALEEETRTKAARAAELRARLEK